MESEKIIGIIKNGFKDGLYTHDTLGFPYNPSNWSTEEESVIPVFRIRMTCGGGMGGASWYEYVRKGGDTLADVQAKMNSNPINRFKHYNDNGAILISTNFVVSIDECCVHIKKGYNENPYYEKGWYEVHTLTKSGHPLQYV